MPASKFQFLGFGENGQRNRGPEIICKLQLIVLDTVYDSGQASGQTPQS